MMAGLLQRDPEAAADEHYDLIVVGGGIYGIMTALEATFRGLRPLLLERADFAAATSANSLRILHGGLRYLQSLDLGRALESIRERAWWLRAFPDLVEPLECLMPLYGEGLRRAPVMRLALGLNDLLCRLRGAALPAGQIVPPAVVQSVFAQVDARGLDAGAIWHDAFAPAAPRLAIEALRWAASGGAVALNYVEVTGLLAADGRITGVHAQDHETDRPLEFRAPAVINAAGPWSRQLAAGYGQDPAALFRPSLAWNVAFRRPALSDHALAVAPRRRGGQIYFLVPWKGALLAGTGHAPWTGQPGTLRVPEALLAEFIDDLNAAVPGLDLSGDDVLRVFAGLLPAARSGTRELALRPVIVDHGVHGGPRGLFSMSGVKLTTARAVADQVLKRAFAAAPVRSGARLERPPPGATPDYPLAWQPSPGDASWQTHLCRAFTDEAVQHLDDLLLRRSSLGDDPARARALAPAAARLLGWDAARRRLELKRLDQQLAALAPAC